jgi:two-component system response regulator
MIAEASPLVMAEDDPDDRFLLQRALRRVAPSLSPLLLSDGVELMQHLDNREAPLPRLLLLDLNMPRMDGLEVLLRLRADARLSAIPAVVLTTSGESENLARVRASGAVDCLCKPCRYGDLVVLLEDVLRRFLPDALPGPAP